MSSVVIPEKAELKAAVIKLLERAGRHPKLTPRILREKAEKILKLEPHTLKSKREYVKKVAIQWWRSEKEVIHPIETASTSSSNSELAKLSKIAIVVGKSSLLKELTEYANNKEKVNYLRKTLRDLNYSFSDIPTDEEIEKLKKKYTQNSQDSKTLDNNEDTPSQRKRNHEFGNSETRKPQKIKISVNEEEAEAEF